MFNYFFWVVPQDRFIVNELHIKPDKYGSATAAVHALSH